MKRNNPGLLNIVVCIGAAMLIGAAIWDQLQRARNERTWYGDIFGIPYDLRMPTLQRLQETFWNRQEQRVIVPRAFGVGWDINFYPLLHWQQ